jgi:GntR family transcriptional regulator
MTITRICHYSREMTSRGIDVEIDRGSPLPLYHQLSEQLRAAIQSGQLAKGQFLTNEIELADAWQVSRPTVRRAIHDLVEEGLLVRRRGVGTQVVNDQVRRPVRLSSLWDDLTEQGRVPTTTVLTLRRAKAKGSVAVALGVEDSTEVIYLERCRSSGKQKLAIMRNWLSIEAGGHLTTESLGSNGLYTLLRQIGIRPHSASQRIGAVSATAANARLLDLAVGSPLLTMRRIMQDDRGRIVELGEHVYDALHYSVEMTVVESN